jgi:hypothetical protein
VRHHVAIALLAVIVAIVAGCGGSSTATKEDYAASVVKARDRVDYALAQITVGTGTLELLLDRMEGAAALIDAAADDLDGAGAAEGFEGETEQLVAAFSELARGLEGVASDARQPELGGILPTTKGLEFPGWVKANRILTSLKRQGIAVEPIGSH